MNYEKIFENIGNNEILNIADDHIINTMGMEIRNFVLNTSTSKLNGVFNEE